MAFKRIALGLSGLSAALAAIAATGRVGILLLFSLIAAALLLVIISALTGIFGGGAEGRRDAAQTVLAILLGRDQPRRTRPSKQKPVNQPASNAQVNAPVVPPEEAQNVKPGGERLSGAVRRYGL